jgi:low affinity Fe/Cu permease
MNFKKIDRWFSKFCDQTSEVTSSSWAFFVFCLSVAIWLLIGPFFNYSENWNLWMNVVLSIATGALLVLLGHSQNKSQKVVQLKLDELIRSQKTANNDMINIERLDDEQLEELIKIFQRRIKNQIN